MKRSIPSQVLLYIVLVVTAIVVLFPLYQAVITSLASEADVSNYPPKILPTNFRLENFVEALNTAPILRYLLNSIIQALLSPSRT